MAYVRKRITNAGQVSTTLVESYRDEMGRPRQRILANLHGEPDTLRALAKLAVNHKLLLERREEEHTEADKEGTGFVMVTDRALTRHNRHIAQIDRQLAVIERDAAVIDKYCTATPEQIRAASRVYRQELEDAAHEVLGRMMQLGSLGKGLKQAKANVRRMRGW